MFNVKCKRSNCIHNKNLNCTAKEIYVKKDTECNTFKPSNEAEVGEIEKVGQPPIRKDIKVDCNAKCIFNTSNICIANGITVQTSKKENCPTCQTFLQK